MPPSATPFPSADSVASHESLTGQRSLSGHRSGAGSHRAGPPAHQVECRARIKVALAAAALSGVRNSSTAAVIERSSASIRSRAASSSTARLRATLAQDNFIAQRQLHHPRGPTAVPVAVGGPGATTTQHRRVRSGRCHALPGMAVAPRSTCLSMTVCRRPSALALRPATIVDWTDIRIACGSVNGGRPHRPSKRRDSDREAKRRRLGDPRGVSTISRGRRLRPKTWRFADGFRVAGRLLARLKEAPSTSGRTVMSWVRQIGGAGCPGAVTGKRECVFCGGRPCRNEHVFADHWHQTWPQAAAATGVKTWGVGRGRGGPLGMKPARVAPIGVFDTKVKIACVPCNSGWMSRLEDAAKVHLKRLIFAERHVVEPEVGRLLARWMAKTAVVINEMNDSTFRLADEQRRAFQSEKLPPFFVTTIYPPCESWSSTTTARCQ